MDPILTDSVESPYLVPFGQAFDAAAASTRPPEKQQKKENEKALGELSEQLQELQGRLYAHHQFSLLLVFQALDAAGKDGTIKAVMSGVNPTGCQVYSFKAPSVEELDHDFLWRIWRALPERGRIGVFNRSHYEEVITVRVNPGFLDAQRLPLRPSLDQLWQERFDSIRQAEKHWARNGTVIVKFWLNVSRDEQRERLLDRINEPDGNWKFNASDLKTRRQWDDYIRAYGHALGETSMPWAPWYAIPADSKSFMRLTVAKIVVDTLAKLPMSYPTLSTEQRTAMQGVKAELEAEGGRDKK
jgi:PPK2 family polyphosphate:nucleotide phosphotransferase